MKEETKRNNKITIINEGKKIKIDQIENNEKESKNKAKFLYTIPLVVLIILAIIYILTQINALLVPFGIIMFVVLWGGDCSSRTCPKCKKWNSTSWIKTEKRIKKYTITQKSILKKEVNKEVKKKYLLIVGKCKNCECEYETKKNRIV